GNARLVGRLNLGSTSATGVLRANETGAVVLGSASGQNIHVRAGTPDSSAGETRFEPNGNVVVGGAVTASGSLQVNGEAAMSRSLVVSQNIKNTNDNSFILMGKDSDLGFVKKSNSGSKLVFASGKSFVVAKSSATAIANPGSETYTDVFKVDADGNQTVYGNSAVSRALTVSSSATINGVINANGGVIVPTSKYVQITDAPTQNNQATNKKYVDDRINTRLATAGGTVTGDLNVNGTVGLKGQVVLSKDLTVNNGKISAQAIELSMGTPYIDFHFNNSSSDYTTRLIENTSGELTLEGALMCKKHMYAWGAVMARNVAPTNPSNGTLITGAPLQSMTEGRGGNGDARGLVANFYSEELVGTSHRAVIYLDGHKRTDAWIFNAGGVIDTPTGAVQTAGSDIRLKSNITPAKDGALERIMKLGTVEFDMKGETRRRRGFIAQQVEKVDAGYTFQGNEQTIDGEKIKILNIDQTAIVADLVSTVQEQQKLILELQKQINTLK
ncbi:tail fiber domain-containing protein, partial [Klebsiella quasipneumoniae]|uniref:tail fiber domain-containing protein n=1 Tax=Klebsiella quasipneumoniae TaxID=1463165 RepID=UPI001FF60775